MKTQNNVDHSSNSERSLEIFIWIAAVFVFIIFLIGSSASASNSHISPEINKSKSMPVETAIVSEQIIEVNHNLMTGLPT